MKKQPKNISLSYNVCPILIAQVPPLFDRVFLKKQKGKPP